MTNALTTWGDVRKAIADRGLKVKAVAAVMGERADVFSRRINDEATMPTPTYIGKLMDAFETLASGVPTA